MRGRAGLAPMNLDITGTDGSDLRLRDEGDIERRDSKEEEDSSTDTSGDALVGGSEEKEEEETALKESLGMFDDETAPSSLDMNLSLSC